jgi:hypothetical protein
VSNRKSNPVLPRGPEAPAFYLAGFHTRQLHSRNQPGAAAVGMTIAANALSFFAVMHAGTSSVINGLLHLAAPTINSHWCGEPYNLERLHETTHF